MLTYLGRLNPDLHDGGKDPECGFVGYNLNHSHDNIIPTTMIGEKMYINGDVFKLTSGWTDCSTLWHLSKIYQIRKKMLKLMTLVVATRCKGPPCIHQQ